MKKGARLSRRKSGAPIKHTGILCGDDFVYGKRSPRSSKLLAVLLDESTFSRGWEAEARNPKFLERSVGETLCNFWLVSVPHPRETSKTNTYFLRRKVREKRGESGNQEQTTEPEMEGSKRDVTQNGDTLKRVTSRVLHEPGPRT